MSGGAISAVTRSYDTSVLNLSGGNCFDVYGYGESERIKLVQLAFSKCNYKSFDDIASQAEVVLMRNLAS